ncbi:MAG: right-handed parallel beta-helix repeat-containing protein, partial [Candidatus Omnitrophota bacterium]
NTVGGNVVSSGDYNTVMFNEVAGSVYSTGDYNNISNNRIAGDLVSYGDNNLISSNLIGGSLFSTGDNNTITSNIVTGNINVSGDNNIVNGNIAGGLISVSGINNTFGMNVELSALAGYIINSRLTLADGAEGLDLQANDGLLMGYAILAGGVPVGSNSAAAGASASAAAVILAGANGNAAAVNAILNALSFITSGNGLGTSQYGNTGLTSAQQEAVSATGKRGEGGSEATAVIAMLGQGLSGAARAAYGKASEAVNDISSGRFNSSEVKDEQSQDNKDPLLQAQVVIGAQEKVADAIDKLMDTVSAGTSTAGAMPYSAAEAASNAAGNSGTGKSGSGKSSINNSNITAGQYPGLTGGILTNNIPVSEWSEGSMSGRGPPESTTSIFSFARSAVSALAASIVTTSSSSNNNQENLDSVKINDGKTLSVSDYIRGQGLSVSSHLETSALILSTDSSSLVNKNNNENAIQPKGGETWVSNTLSSQTTGSLSSVAGTGLEERVFSTSSANRSGDTSADAGRSLAENQRTPSGSSPTAESTTVQLTMSNSLAVSSGNDEKLGIQAPSAESALEGMLSRDAELLSGNNVISFNDHIASGAKTSGSEEQTSAQAARAEMEAAGWIFTPGSSFAVLPVSRNGGSRYSFRAGAEAQSTAAGIDVEAGLLSQQQTETINNGDSVVSRNYFMADRNNDGKAESKVVTGGTIVESGKVVYNADYIGRNYGLNTYNNGELIQRDTIVLNPDNTLGSYIKEAGFTAITGLNSGFATDKWEINYNKEQTTHEVNSVNNGEIETTITVKGGENDLDLSFSGRSVFTAQAEGTIKQVTEARIVSGGKQDVGEYIREITYNKSGEISGYSVKYDYNEAGIGEGLRSREFQVAAGKGETGGVREMSIAYRMKGEDGAAVAGYSYTLKDIDYISGANIGGTMLDAGYLDMITFAQAGNGYFEVDLFNYETVYEFAREAGVGTYNYEMSYQGAGLSEKMTGEWALKEGAVLNGGYGWSEKGVSVEDYGKGETTKDYSFEQYYVDAAGSEVGDGRCESGFGLMRMSDGVFSSVVLKGDVVAEDGVRNSVYYARGVEKIEDTARQAIQEGGFGSNALEGVLETFYQPENMDGGKGITEVNLVVVTMANGTIYGYNKDAMLTGGQVSSPEYEQHGMPYVWYAWHCEGSSLPASNDPQYLVPNSLLMDNSLSQEMISRTTSSTNYLYSPIGTTAGGKTVGVYGSYQDQENNYLLGQAYVPKGSGNGAYLYNIYTVNPGFYSDKSSWESANNYIVKCFEQYTGSFFGVKNAVFTRAGDPSNPTAYVPLSRIREYDASNMAMYPEDRTFARDLGFSYSENLAQMPRGVESYWMTNARMSAEEVSSSPWVENPLQNMVVMNMIPALGNSLFGGENKDICGWEGVMSMVENGAAGSIYGNNKGGYYHTIGEGGFMLGTAEVVDTKENGWQRVISDTGSGKIYAQYQAASGAQAAVYALYDKQSDEYVLNTAGSFIQLYQIEGVGTIPLTVGLTSTGWVPLVGVQAVDSKATVWMTPVADSDGIYETLSYDARANTPWSLTGEYYKQDEQKNWVKAEAPAVSIADAVVSGQLIGTNADNDCAALAYSYLAALKSGEQVTSKQAENYRNAFKAASGMDTNGAAIEEALRGFYALGMAYKYEKVSSLEGLPDESVILAENKNGLHSMVLLENMGDKIKVYDCEGLGDTTLFPVREIKSGEIVVKGALVPAGFDASALVRAMEMSVSVSERGSMFYDNAVSYLYTETYFNAEGVV